MSDEYDNYDDYEEQSEQQGIPSEYSFDRNAVSRVSELESTSEMDEQKGTENTDIDPTKFGLKETKPRNIYCDKAELMEEIRKYQEDGVATDKLGELIIKIAVRMTTMVRFWRYPHALKEELAQNAIYRMLVSVPKFDLKDKSANAFGYMSMIAYRDMLHTLKRHFKQNKVRDAVADAYLTKLSQNPNDDRIGMLKQTLQRSEEYNAFMKSSNDGGKKEVDMFALSKSEQERRYKESLRKGKKKTITKIKRPRNSK